MATTLLSSISNLTSKILSTIQGSSEGGDIERQVDRLSNIVSRIRAVHSDAEEMEIEDEFIKLWLHQLKEVAYDAENILCDFNYNMDTASMELEYKLRFDNRKRKFEVTNSVLSPTYDSSFLYRVKYVTEQFSEICDAWDTLRLRKEDGVRKFRSVRSPSSSFMSPTLEIFGRKGKKRELIDALKPNKQPEFGSIEDFGGIETIALVGMIGMGKTTLAKHVFNDETMQKHFHLRGWVWVSEFYDEITITKSIIECFTNQECCFLQLDALQKRLKEIIKGERFLLVLDDIWNENRERWEVVKLPLLFGADGSRILITTENHKVAKCMESNLSIPLDGLSKSSSWALFSRLVFSGKNPNNLTLEIVEIGEKIVDKCKGVPLVLRTLGGLLASATDEQLWEDVLESNAWELEEYRKSMAHILHLSYCGLPSHLKPCFRSCAMFPKGHEFETDRLVRIWEAQGLIQAEESKQMEVGRTYVDDLLQRSFFHNKVNLSSTTKSKFIMHDLMHDLAKSIVGGESAIIESEELGKKDGRKNFRHLTVVVKKDMHISFDPFHGCLALRSLFVHSYNQARFHLDRHFFNHEFMQYLHVLDLNFWKSTELPETIRNLKHLHFLGLSGQNLPESISSLHNLQTLEVRSRGNRIMLPNDFNHLRNLRHLIVSPWDVSKMPIGIGCLTNLQTLSVFAVSNERGSATLNELHSLNNLRDELHIMGLHHVIDDFEINSMIPNLRRKKYLTHLHLHWSTFVQSKARNNDLNLLNILQPHTNIQQIVVEGYRGEQLPSWFGDERFTRLTYLKFGNCMNCMNLPAVGQLPVLRHLELERLKGLKIVGQEFYGNNSISFPSLETLSIYDMPELENWCYRDREGSPFPCLRELRVSLCRKLRLLQLSNFPALQRCSINWCNKMIGIDGVEEHYWSITGSWKGILDLRVRGMRSLNSSVIKLEKHYETHNMQTIRPTLMIIGCPLLEESLRIFNKSGSTSKPLDKDDSTSKSRNLAPVLDPVQFSLHQLKKNSPWLNAKSTTVRKSPRYGLVQAGMMRKVLDTPIAFEDTSGVIMQPNFNDESIFPFEEEMTHSSHEQNNQISPTCAVLQTSMTTNRNKILLGFSFMKSAPTIETITSSATTSITPPIETTIRVSY